MKVGFWYNHNKCESFFFSPFHPDSTGTHHQHPAPVGRLHRGFVIAEREGEGEKKQQPKTINFIYGSVPLALLVNGVNKPVHTDEDPRSDSPKPDLVAVNVIKSTCRYG